MREKNLYNGGKEEIDRGFPDAVVPCGQTDVRTGQHSGKLTANCG